jgi:hypothetical protein
VIATAPTITQQIFAAILICSAFVLLGVAEVSRLASKAVASLHRIEKQVTALDERSAERMQPIHAAAVRLNSLGRQ